MSDDPFSLSNVCFPGEEDDTLTMLESLLGPPMGEGKPPSRKRAKMEDETLPFSGNAPHLDGAWPDATNIDFDPSFMFGLDNNNNLQGDIPMQVDMQGEIEALRADLDMNTAQLPHFYAIQKQLPVPFRAGEADALHEDQRLSMLNCTHLKERCGNLLSQHYLNPQQLFQITEVQREADLLIEQLKLYQEELQHYWSNDYQLTPRCFCSLVVVNQPFPKPVKHQAKISGVNEDPIVVKIICAPKANCKATGPVRAHFDHDTFESSHSKQTDLKIKDDQENITEEGTATFLKIRFPKGSRQKIVRLRFSVNVTYLFEGISHNVVVESNRSTEQFIIMTNENQWKQSTGTILKKSVFRSTEPISWKKFSNILQLQYLKATRQALDNPERPLSIRELEYIKDLKLKKEIIYPTDFAGFWDWFGEALHKIRHTKPFSSMWLRGQVLGFIKKEEINARLMAAKAKGTFVMRFSESKSGQVTLARVEMDPHGNRSIVHCLVSDEQCNDVIKFLGTFNSLQWVLLANTSFYTTSETCFTRAVHKAEVIRSHHPEPSETVQPVTGYDSQMQDGTPFMDPNI